MHPQVTGASTQLIWWTGARGMNPSQPPPRLAGGTFVPGEVLRALGGLNRIATREVVLGVSGHAREYGESPWNSRHGCKTRGRRRLLEVTQVAPLLNRGLQPNRETREFFCARILRSTVNKRELGQILTRSKSVFYCCALTPKPAQLPSSIASNVYWTALLSTYLPLRCFFVSAVANSFVHTREHPEGNRSRCKSHTSTTYGCIELVQLLLYNKWCCSTLQQYCCTPG